MITFLEVILKGYESNGYKRDWNSRLIYGNPTSKIILNGANGEVVTIRKDYKTKEYIVKEFKR